MRDLELWLEAAPGSCAVPPDCFAALRPRAATTAGPLTCCVPNEASCLGEVVMGDGPAVVDIFQRVGSINLGLLQPGAIAEAAVAWPGLLGDEVLRLRLAVVAVDLAAATASTVEKAADSQFQCAVSATTSGSLASPTSQPRDPQDSPIAVMLEATRKRFAVALATKPPAVEAQPQPPAVYHAGPSLRSPRQDEPQKPYRPIVLNNCDQIIPNLYLGGVAAASDKDKLVQQGIRAVCCCVRELEFPTREFSKEVEYYRVDIEDIGREPIELFFPEATEFIHSWISREQPVLVHCRAGVSRSASVVIAYLIAYHGYSLHDAFFLVRSHRSIVTPNIGFMEKLGEYEEAKRGTEPTIEMNKYMSWYTTPERAAVPDLKPD